MLGRLGYIIIIHRHFYFRLSCAESIVTQVTLKQVFDLVVAIPFRKIDLSQRKARLATSYKKKQQQKTSTL